jgi:hypothetical protein
MLHHLVEGSVLFNLYKACLFFKTNIVLIFFIDTVATATNSDSWCQNFVNYQHFYLKFLSIGFILFLNWKLSKFFFVISKTSLWLLLSTTLCNKVCQWLATVWWFSLDQNNIKCWFIYYFTKIVKKIVF